MFILGTLLLFLSFSDYKEIKAQNVDSPVITGELSRTNVHNLKYPILGFSDRTLLKGSYSTQNQNFDNVSETVKHYNGYADCNFEVMCNWTWNTETFSIMSAKETEDTGPETDANLNKTGQFLLLRPNPTVSEFHIRSPLLQPTKSTCRLHLWIYQVMMNNTEIRLVGDRITEANNKDANHTQWLVDKIPGSNSKRWQRHEFPIGQISENFTVLLEVVSPNIVSSDALIAFDSVSFVDCYPDNDDTCTLLHYRCKSSHNCINSTSVCDITKDCINGDDEQQNCDLMPYGSRCDFEEDWCGWYNVEGKVLEWVRHNGSTPTNNTGPNFDHTFMNKSGKYLYVNMLKDEADFGSTATLRSILFNPPPRVHGNITSKYYNSCKIRFYLHKTGKHRSGILLQVTELRPHDNYSIDLYWEFDDYGDKWVRKVKTLPNITHRYFVHFHVKKGLRYISDIAIDDVSLTPECFGINIPADELNGYVYWNPDEDSAFSRKTHEDFVNETYYEVTSCGAKGRFGPTYEDCSSTYKKNEMDITVLNESKFKGVQRWTVPSDGFYTFILYGASGGKGSSGMGSSRGSMVRTVVPLNKGENLYFLVGQEGTSACFRTLGHQENSSCSANRNGPIPKGIRGVLYMDITDGGGGGGGATYIFTKNASGHIIPLAVAGGGGGLGLGRFIDDDKMHGQAVNISAVPVSGKSYGKRFAGGGGGWSSIPSEEFFEDDMTGTSLLNGGTGGKACYNSTDGRGDGGFGGGGGGCRYGGGGGGFAGGDGSSPNSTNGRGGSSFVDPSRTLMDLSEAHAGYNTGPGYVLIVPSVLGCNCDHRCVALDYRRSLVACVCPKGWSLDPDGKTCKGWGLPDDSGYDTYPSWFVIGLIITIICITAAFALVCFVMYNRYQQRSTGILKRKMLSGTDLQLDRLRFASDGMMTEYNPNYEFGGVVYTLRDLKDIPREQLRLVKALGQGAFGEVYQGFYRQRPCDTVEMPVAVKTLPEMSTSQAEMDFLMEALIMSKFNHPNIVHFIGVCFDKHPRFIVLELLAGGDLKNFLRESRPKPERGSSLTMKDLILIAVDVAKGCKYLEDNRFIHRDIAARNCLLTTKGPGRCVKIADFGMSRDVYRSDYYRKGGKAMLPIKWMPPEAFLDGIFTSKTDVWSYGVLLWEIMSMGYMPYTGCANREVMQLVTSGGRLDPPMNCPSAIYGIMTQCWHPTPEHRPTFGTILERLGYCMQDQQVVNAPLPVFHRLPSAERESTLIRPTKPEENCLQVSQSSDYLVPNSTVPTLVETTSSVEKLLPENSSNSWETPFSMHFSKSTQPLLLDELRKDSEDSNSIQPKDSSLSNHEEKQKDPVSIRTGLSLDAGALVKQVMTPQIRYTNLMSSSPANYTVSNNCSNTSNSSSKLIANSEINC